MKKMSKEIVERIEGEAGLELVWENGAVAEAKISFLNYRGIEEILQGRHPFDALAIAPRVCGICSHAHATAAVLALEHCYEAIGYPLLLSSKAKAIREIVLHGEKIQNHLKWFVFSFLPALDSTLVSQKIKIETQKAFATVLKMGAVFSGQWPHGSYVMLGGVTCDPTRGEVMEAKMLLREVASFCEKVLFGTPLQAIVTGAVVGHGGSGLLSQALEVLTSEKIASLGRSHGRFLVLGGGGAKGAQKCLQTRVLRADVKHVSESLAHTFFEENGHTYGKSARYKGKFFETGPLARMMVQKEPWVREFHRKYKDALATRVLARMVECAYLIEEARILLEGLDIKEPSCVAPFFPIESLSIRGRGVVEAARGSLIHTVTLEKGKIYHYDIITPTVWNLGNGTKESPSVAQKALLGIRDMKEVDLVFKGLDVCSVCTAQ